MKNNVKPMIVAEKKVLNNIINNKICQKEDQAVSSLIYSVIQIKSQKRNKASR